MEHVVLDPLPAGTAPAREPIQASAGVGSLLYLLNVSNPDRLAADSGWLFADLLCPALGRAGVEVTVTGPAAVGDQRVGHEPLAAAGTKYQARFGFDVEATTAVLRRVRPEVVVANQVENAPGVRAALLAAGSGALLACYCHYVPFHPTPDGGWAVDPSLSDGGLGLPVLLAFYAGLLACDRVLVHSPTARTWIEHGARLLGVELGERLRVVPPPVDPRLLSAAPTAEQAAAKDAVGLYNHRLYRHYGTERFVELAELLGQALPVRLRVADLFGRRSPERTRLDPSPDRYLERLRALPHVQVVSDHGRRERYRALLHGSAFALAPFRPAVTWSMSVVDCLSMGVPVVAPALGWLAEPGVLPPELLFDRPEQAVRIVERLLEEPVFAARMAEQAVRSVRELSPDKVAARYLAAVTR
ncbi:Glycosyltransferase involved in cell wall bisynthesis [Actinosynnema pretiosum]|nr:Glycosyltransferase involved in cell wall bisynthesis [Actinosynnema pretiosum]